MGCDGYVLNPFEPSLLRLRCHSCGKPVRERFPSIDHEGCISDDGRLRVDLDAENYEPR